MADISARSTGDPAGSPTPGTTVPGTPVTGPPLPPERTPTGRTPVDPTTETPPFATGAPTPATTDATGPDPDGTADEGAEHGVQEHGGDLATETGRQGRTLYEEARSQVGEQVVAQQKRLVHGLYALSGEVGKMAEDGGRTGPAATHLARQASDRIADTARWIDDRDPGQVVEDVKAYARRRPAMFLTAAALLGVVAGRLARNLGGRSKSKKSAGRTGADRS
ncbi:RAD23 family protein [Hamadaea tsunoensis]|uniref:hypothetical protein n=1 Tax=Hamadaea tsunoensis TaxID=53368 RepID=UPI00042763D8|nr:hypothetical protein [Hamadaea tsunoensis]